MPNNFESDEIEIPAFGIGGFVKEDGLAVVHEGEYIIPAPGSAAVIEPVEMNNQVINYYFPVEIVIVGNLSEEERETIKTSIWEELSEMQERFA